MSKKRAKKTNTGQQGQTSARKKPLNLEDYIEPLYMDGLQGRMLRLPPAQGKKREILLVYGHHPSIERMFGVAEALNRYGGVTLPDLPGFGGMESFYKLHQKPSLDNLADYLAAFVKLRYKRRRITIIGLSFGFVIATRMLQKYPELAKKVDILVSAVGFSHREDFKIKPHEYWGLRTAATIFSNRLPAWFMQHVLLRPFIIRATYQFVADRHDKLKDANETERQARIDFEVYLWQCNDIRTHMDTTLTMLKLDLCKQQVDLPVYHIAVPDDRYFSADVVEQHLAVIYREVHVLKADLPAHAPTVVADAAAAAPLIPLQLRRILAKDVS